MTRHGKAAANPSTPIASSSSVDPISAVTGSTQGTGESQVVEDSFARETVEQIEALVESFRTGNTKKSQTIFKIGQVLAAEPKGDDNLKSESLEQYASTLDGIEAQSARSDKHGAVFANPVLGKRKDELDRRSQRHDDPNGSDAGDSRDADVNDFIDRISQRNDQQEGGSSFDVDEESGNESELDDDGGLGHDNKGRSNKKQRIYESQMPWFSKEQHIRRSSTNRSCNKTRKILDVIQKDPVAVKRWIRCASSAPAGFPSTEWDALLKGDTIDIDTVFSSLHHIHSIDEGVGRVGSTEIQFGRPKPAAKVETSGQWTAAFNLIVKATAFVFPHRYDELRQYGDYIEELFSAKLSVVHPKLFKYDEAVRYKVGQGQNMLLTDRDQFTRYYEAIVAPDGAGAERSSEGGKAGQGKGGRSGDKSDICHRFNGAKGCSAGDSCKFKHICKKCRKRGHGKMDCKVEEAV
jgi:hypothetical protein